jgi:hypothetical protein
MPSEVFVETIEFAVPALEAVPFESVLPANYPLPALKVAGSPTKRSCQSIVIENPLLRVTFLPELGGRMISLFDKRTGLECLPGHQELKSSNGGPRGLWIPQGVQWQIGETIRRGSMAEVDVQIVENEEDTAKLVIFELVSGLELSWHLWVNLPSDRAEIQFELRALNRSLREIPYQSGISVPFGVGAVSTSEGALLAYAEEAGITVHFAPGSVDAGFGDAEASWLIRKPPKGLLAPRQTDHWRFSVTPVSGLASPQAVSKSGAMEVSAASVRVQSTVRMAGSTLFLHIADGSTMEAKVDLQPEQIRHVELPEETGMPKQVLLRGRGGEDLLHWPTRGQLPKELINAREKGGPGLDLLSEPVLERLLLDVGRRPAASLAMAHLSIQRNDKESADDSLEDALLFNGDDPLAWWLKASISRDRSSGDEALELPNAHFLAPMEPLLRAEAFLSQPLDPSFEPSALVRSIAGNPEYLVECACRLLEAGLRQDAARWIQESLRHRDLTMLRLLSAWNLMHAAYLKSEAAIQVQTVDSKGIGPPYPWRTIEGQALKDLSIAFPQSHSIREFLGMFRRWAGHQ